MAFISKRPKPKRKPLLAELFEDLHEFGDTENKFEQQADKALEEFKKAPFSKKLATRYKWRQELIRAIYCEVDAKEIPYEDLKIMTDHSSYDFPDTKYAERVKSPVTGIRAFCVNCQGGSIAAVRNCSMITCALFPFRMGSNPFYGRVENADAEVTEEFDEESEANGNPQA